jgi:hypothetical protein
MSYRFRHESITSTTQIINPSTVWNPPRIALLGAGEVAEEYEA